MPSNSSEISLFSIEPIILSDNSLFSIEEYSHVNNKRCHVKTNNDQEQSSTSIFSIEPLNIGKTRYIKLDTTHVKSSLSNATEDCVNKPLNFQRVPRQESVKRYNFLCSDCQIAFDTGKPCCGNLCLSKFGKENLRGLRHKYLSLNDNEQDTFLIANMQLVKDHLAVSCSQQVEYYLSLTTESCRVAFKISYSIWNMRLQRIQHRLLKGWWVPFNNRESSCKGLIGRHAVRWREIYFSKQCDVMPTT